MSRLISLIFFILGFSHVAAFEAMRAYEKKEKASGEKVDHGFLKEMSNK